MKLEKYSMGVGDRFAHQVKAQLQAIIEANAQGIDVVPVWNKSHREHTTIGTAPESVKIAVDRAVKSLDWTKSYYVDADHINISNVALFLESCNFFTLDVADYIGEKATAERVAEFISTHKELVGEHVLPNIDSNMIITEELLQEVAEKYLLALDKASELYSLIQKEKGKDNFITEVSMDETDAPQTPEEIFLILAELSNLKVPVQTIAPKFSGRFNKGVNYVGDLKQFDKEFDADVAVLSYAVSKFDLPENLKLSVHSGSDKFSIYEPINKAIKKHDAGLHLKTAGTTWLEEVIGLAEAGGEALEFVKDLYAEALDRYEELATPYATVLDIDCSKLPSKETVNSWDAETFAATVRHELDDPRYDVNFRQLMHVAYKLAAKRGDEYDGLLEKYSDIISRNVKYNILKRHIEKIFPVG